MQRSRLAVLALTLCGGCALHVNSGEERLTDLGVRTTVLERKVESLDTVLSQLIEALRENSDQARSAEPGPTARDPE